jgi:hypothetical protein
MWYLYQKSNKKDQTAPMKSEELNWDFEKSPPSMSIVSNGQSGEAKPIETEGRPS